MAKRHQHASTKSKDSTSDSERSSSDSDSDDEPSINSASDDKEELTARKKRKGKKKRKHYGHAHVGVHTHGEMNLMAIVIVGFVVVAALGLYYLYKKNGSFPFGSSTSPTGTTSTSDGSGVSVSRSTAGGGSSGASSESVKSSSSSSSNGGGTSASSSGSTLTTSGANSSPTSSGSSGGGQSRVVSFFENWKGVDPASLDFSGLYAAFWFTAVPDTTGAVDLHESTTGQAKVFAEAATKAGTKPILTVGGWSGSAPFSKLVSAEDSRTKFVDAMVKLTEENSFEGVDIDWEYPGKAGASEDFDAKKDLPNLLLLLQEIRKKIGDDKLLSMDTSAGVYTVDGTPSNDMSEFGKTLDFITIMTYDFTTFASKTTGPNFSYSAKCASGFDIPTTVQAWIDAKFPAEKISVGLASYGYAWEVDEFVDGGGVQGTSSSIYQTSSKTLSETDGAVTYDKLVSDYLDKMDYTFDECTSTPFLYSKDTKRFIAYDDEKSFAVKGGYAKEHGESTLHLPLACSLLADSQFNVLCSVYAGLTQDTSRTLTKAAIDAC
ncbi:hypothetical protein JCM5350_000659 [Sporobolomyces pararoseus]